MYGRTTAYAMGGGALSEDTLAARLAEALQIFRAASGFIDLTTPQGDSAWASAGFPEYARFSHCIFCDRVLSATAPIVWLDTHVDAPAHAAAHIRDHGIGFYAAAPLTGQDGQRVGMMALWRGKPCVGPVDRYREVLLGCADTLLRGPR